jgi:26S proteasome regulatory subunit N7
MAKSFGVSSDFIDKELSNFIYIGKINCKIDKVSGVI